MMRFNTSYQKILYEKPCKSEGCVLLFCSAQHPLIWSQLCKKNTLLSNFCARQYNDSFPYGKDTHPKPLMHDHQASASLSRQTHALKTQTVAVAKSGLEY